MSHPDHDHEEHDATHAHDHGISADADRRYLLGALGLLLAYMAAEIVVASFTHSLALLSDAGHMLSDAGAIGVALWAMRLAARPAQGAWTFGWKRAEILSALGNGVTMVAVAALVGFEAITRLVSGHTAVSGGPVLVVALAGVVVNIGAAWLLAKANRSSLNVQGAYQHILTDLYGFIGTAVAAVVILTTGWMQADAIASLLVVGLMLHAAWGLLMESGRVLLEVAPAGTSLEDIRAHLLEVGHVTDVHDLHVWTLTSELPTLSAHVVLDDSCFRDEHAPQILQQIQECLAGHFDIEHSTFQLETSRHADLEHLIHH